MVKPDSATYRRFIESLTDMGRRRDANERTVGETERFSLPDRVQEIAVQRHDHVGLVERLDRVHGRSERHRGTGRHAASLGGVVREPRRLGPASRGLGRRREGLVFLSTMNARPSPSLESYTLKCSSAHRRKSSTLRSAGRGSDSCTWDTRRCSDDPGHKAKGSTPGPRSTNARG